MKRFDIKATVLIAWQQQYPEWEFLRQFAAPYKNIQMLVFVLFMYYIGFEIVFLVGWMCWWVVKQVLWLPLRLIGY